MKTIYSAFFALCALPALAIDFGDIELIDGGRAPSGNQWIGIDFQLEDGWKTYWKYSGQNGLSPYFDYEGSENIAEVIYHWPEPHLIGDDGIEAVGYKESFALAVEIIPEDASKPVHLKLFANLGVCDDVCIPVPIEADMNLSQGASLAGMSLQRAAAPAFDENALCGADEKGEFVLSVGEDNRTYLEREAHEGTTLSWSVSKTGICKLS